MFENLVLKDFELKQSFPVNKMMSSFIRTRCERFFKAIWYRVKIMKKNQGRNYEKNHVKLEKCYKIESYDCNILTHNSDG